MVPSAGLQQDSLVDLALGFELLSLLVAADATGGREGGDVVRSHILRSPVMAMGRSHGRPMVGPVGSNFGMFNDVHLFISPR